LHNRPARLPPAPGHPSVVVPLCPREGSFSTSIGVKSRLRAARTFAHRQVVETRGGGAVGYELHLPLPDGGEALAHVANVSSATLRARRWYSPSPGRLDTFP
jgi:hypothetical protein